jgi:hypothetical protein
MNSREKKYYQVGLLHGRELKPAARGMGLEIRQSLAKILQIPEKEAVIRGVAHYRQRLDALPPLTEYPELKGMRECVLAYNQGMADGSEVTLDDVFLRANFRHTLQTMRLKKAPSAAGSGPGCTLVYFPRSDRGPLVANNNDGLARQQQYVQPSWIVANRAGMIFGTVSSGVFDDEVSPQEFPAPVFLMAYEMCSTTSEAVDLLTHLCQFWEPCNTLVADSHGNSAIIEKSACRFGVRRSPDGFSATTEMSAEDPTYKAYLWKTRERSLRTRGLTQDCADWTYWKAAERRSARLLKLVEADKTAPTFAKIEETIYDHIGQPEQVHMDGSKCHPDQEEGEWTLRTTIWVVRDQAAQYSFAEPPVSGHLTERRWKKFENIELVF